MAKKESKPRLIEREWKIISEWPTDLHSQIEQLGELERIYALLQTEGPAEMSEYLLAMDFLRHVRRSLRYSIACSILSVHEIETSEPEEEKPPAA